jgi:hypothetical protein
MADWAELSELLYGDDRLMAEAPRDDNVIPIRRRSTRADIHAVRIQEERRGKRQ